MFAGNTEPESASRMITGGTCTLLRNYKVRIDNKVSELTGFLRDAYARYPSSMKELERRRELQNCAMSMCWQLMNELQHAVETFDVDINLYKRHVQALDREIKLIKKWRQLDGQLLQADDPPTAQGSVATLRGSV